MLDDPEMVFHRTLLPYVRPPVVNPHARPIPITAPHLLRAPQDPLPAFPKAPVVNSFPLSSDPGGGLVAGYRFVAGRALTYALLRYDADGRRFADHATHWEHGRSRLCRPGSGFLPIVDGDGLVVGHAGRVQGHVDLIVAADVHPNPADLADALKHSRVFVRVGRLGGDSPENMKRWGISDDVFDVMTSIDGEVVSGGAAYSRGVEPDDHVLADPLLLFDITRVVARLAFRAGGFMVKSVGRQVFRRTMLDGAKAEILTTGVSSRYARGLKTTIGYDARMGIPPEHLGKMTQAARETNVIAVFRANKSAAIDLIRQGAVPKPKYFNPFKTSRTTGVLTAETTAHVELAWSRGYLVVEEDLVARLRVGGKVVQELPVQRGSWTIEKGQVLNSRGAPVVGDYDLLGVLPVESPGSVLVGVPKDLETGDFLGPHVKRYQEALNAKLDMPRVLHGANDQFISERFGGLTDDIAYAVYPDGYVYVMEGKAAQQSFYDRYGRKTVMGDGGPPVSPPVVGPPNLRVIQGGKR